MKNVKSEMINDDGQLKVAVVCDWLTTMGGAERVVLELHRMFPDAPIYTSSYAPERMPLFAGAEVRTSFIQNLPFSTKHQLWPVLRRFHFSGLELNEYDLVISSSGAEAKAVKVGSGAKLSLNNLHLTSENNQTTKNEKRKMKNGRRPLHINYCHSPTQYYWVRPEEYMSATTAGGVGFLNPLWRFGLKLLKPWMKRWDYLAAQNPDYILANSTEVKRRIRKFYNRDSEVVYPPVDTKRFNVNSEKQKRSGFLIVGRQVHHKRFDLAVKACSELGLELTVAGDGPEHEYLKSVAGPSVKFVRKISDEQVVERFQSASGSIFPQNDDFGIVAVEAMAAGAPVIAFKAGGALDTVVDGKTGVYFEEQTVESLVEALKSFESKQWNHEEIVKHADNFSVEKFETSIRQVISKSLSRANA